MRKNLPGAEEDNSGPDEMAVFSIPDSLFAECCRFMRSKITRLHSDNPPRSILISSALKGEGKTFVACNLAASISQTPDEYVLLVDSDLRNPRMHKVFGIPSVEKGLATYLEGNAALPELLKKTAFDKLTLLPAGNPAAAPAELLSSERMKELIREIRDRYRDRFIIIDSAPLGLAPETSVIANSVDAVLLVVRHGKSPRDAVKEAVKRIKKEKLMGVIYNAYDESSELHNRYGYYKHGYGKNKR